jgi:hypothetical protein
MRKLLNPDFVLAFLVASLFWSAVLGWQAAYVPTEKEKQACYEAAKKSGHKTEECKTLWERTTTDPVALFTLVLAFSTVGMWTATVGLYRSTNRLWSAAREEFIASHRPKIILREAFTATFLNDEPISVYLHLANIGEGAGTIVRSMATVQIIATSEMPMIHGSVEVKNDLGDIKLEPGEARLIRVPGDMPKWRPDRFVERDYGTGSQQHLLVRAVIHVIGQIIYVDERGVQRRTAFRRRLKPERQRFYKIPEEPDLDYSD